VPGSKARVLENLLGEPWRACRPGMDCRAALAMTGAIFARGTRDDARGRFALRQQ
jgi:hypothetical protein